MRAKSGRITRWLPLIVLLAAIAAVWASGLYRFLTLEAMAEHRDLLMSYVKDHAVAALACYMAVYVVTIALSLPGGAVLTILGGFLFGWPTSGLATVVAATAGATVVFLIARSSFGAVLAERAGPRAHKLAEGFRRDAFNYLLFLRLVPLFPFWLVNIAPALFNVRLATYVASTFFGILPATFAFAMLGSGLDSILDAGTLITPQLLAAFAALGVVAVIPVIVKRVRDRNAVANHGDNAGAGSG